jgi:hypothetical protein
MVERRFPEGLGVLTAESLDTVIHNNATEQVTWIRSFVTDDRQRTFCVYDAPTPEAVRRAASRSGLPIDSIDDVTVLDPYCFHGRVQ